MRLRGLALAMAIVCYGAWAGAQESPDAQIARGLELRRAGRDDEALEAFRSAWSTSHELRALAQMALAEQALGRWVDAERDLAAVMTSRNDPWVRSHARPLADSLVAIRQHITQLDVRSDVVGAEVLVGGTVVGTLPLAEPIHVASGTVEFTVRAPGRATVSRTLTATPGALLRETVALAPVQATAVVAAQPPAEPVPARPPEPVAISPARPPRRPEGPVTVAPMPAPLTAAQTPAASPSSTPRALGITALAVGGVGLVVGAVFAGFNGSAASAGTSASESSLEPYGSWFRYQQANPTVTDSDALCATAQSDPSAALASVRDLCSQVATQQTVAIVSFAAGGALAVTGAVLLLTAPSPAVERVARNVRVSPWLASGNAGATLTVRW